MLDSLADLGLSLSPCLSSVKSWVRTALRSSCASATTTHAWDEPRLCPTTQARPLTRTAPGANCCRALVSPVCKSGQCLPSGAKAPKAHRIRVSSCAVLCKDLTDSVHLRLSCRHAALHRCPAVSHAVVRGALFPEGTLNGLRISALQVSSITPNWFDSIKPRLI